MKKYLLSTRWLFLTAFVIIIIDQVTKYFVRTNLAFGEVWAPWDWLLPYARLIHINNTGAAFGMFQNANPVFMVLALIVSAGIIYYYPHVPATEKVVRFALSLQLAGALGNLIDRIVFGKVTDFISVGNFAIWNVADASITVGVFVLLIAVWWQDRKAKKEQASIEAQPVVTDPGKEN